MAEVFSNSPCMLGKRVLSPHSSHGLVGQLDFSAKKRRFAHGLDQGQSDRYEAAGGAERNRSLSPVRVGKRARPLSPLQPSHLLGQSGDLSRGDAFGFGQHQQTHRHEGMGASLKDKELQELTALRSQVTALRMHVAEKESGLTVTQEENARLCEGLNVSQKEAERLASENRILKRAVSIQNTKGKELEAQLHSLQQAAGQAAEYVKRLEQTNYALSVRVQAMGNPGPNDFMGGQRPPDVF